MECELCFLIFLSLKIQFPYSGSQIPDHNCGAAGIASLTSAKCQVLLTEFVIDIPVKVANNWCVNKYKTIFYWCSITPSQTCFFFASNFKIKYYCCYAKNVCKPNRFFSHCSCLDFLPERDINCNILNHIFPCFADSGYSTAAYPPGPSPVFYCCYYFRPSVRVFGLGWSWIPCPRYTQNFICRREMCRWQAIFIHFSRARERRAAKPSWREKFAQRTKKNNNKRKKERLLFV